MDSFSLVFESYFCIQFSHTSEHIRPDDTEIDSGFQGDFFFFFNAIPSSDFSFVNRGKLTLFRKMAEGTAWISWALVVH